MDFADVLERYRKFIQLVVSSYPEWCREDLRQEGLLGLFRGCCRFDSDRGVFDAYIKECIRNAVRSGYRRFRKDECTVPMEPEVEETIADGSVPFDEKLAEADGIRALFGSLRESLTEREEQVLDLHLEGCTCTEIARRLGIGAKSADNAMTRVKQKLRKAAENETG